MSTESSSYAAHTWKENSFDMKIEYHDILSSLFIFHKIL